MRTTLLILFILFTFHGFSQNVQLYYYPDHTFHKDISDYDKNRIQLTFEIFKADRWGDTYMFVDFNFKDDKKNMTSAYTEVTRNQKLGQFPVRLHLEFNGGVSNSGSFPSAYIVGANYPFKVGSFIMGANLSYKYWGFRHPSHDGQITITWAGNLLNDKFTLCGFADFWTENKDREGKKERGKKLIALTGPQFWYNPVSKLSLGSAIVIGYNHITQRGGYITPSIAAKWTFE